MLLGFRFLMSLSCGGFLPSAPTSACFLRFKEVLVLNQEFGLEVVGFGEGERRR